MDFDKSLCKEALDVQMTKNLGLHIQDSIHNGSSVNRRKSPRLFNLEKGQKLNEISKKFYHDPPKESLVPQVVGQKSEESILKRRASPRLKEIVESKRPYYGPFRKEPCHHRGEEIGNTHTLDALSFSCERKVGEVKTRGSSENRRFSPRLKELPQIERPYYGPKRKELQHCSNSNMIKELYSVAVKQDFVLRVNEDSYGDQPLESDVAHLKENDFPNGSGCQHSIIGLKVHFKERSSKVLKVPNLVCNDISGSQEDICIPVTNSVDDAPLTLKGFVYTKTIQVAENLITPPNAVGCECKGTCTNPRTCACAKLNGSDFPYVHKDGGRLIEAKDVVVECGPNCGCGPSCINRISQQGLKYHLEVFRTEKKGWAVKTKDFIPSGAPVCEYIGVLRKTHELDSVSENDYIFEIDCLQTMKEIEGRERRLGDVSASASKLLEKMDKKTLESNAPEFCIDAGSVGNVARFINHSCEPNLFAQCVLSSHHDLRLARVVLFAADDIAPLEELTYDYGYRLDSVIDSSGNIREQPCYCGTSDCRKRLF